MIHELPLLLPKQNSRIADRFDVSLRRVVPFNPFLEVFYGNFALKQAVYFHHIFNTQARKEFSPCQLLRQSIT